MALDGMKITKIAAGGWHSAAISGNHPPCFGFYIITLSLGLWPLGLLDLVSRALRPCELGPEGLWFFNFG